MRTKSKRMRVACVFLSGVFTMSLMTTVPVTAAQTTSPGGARIVQTVFPTEDVVIADVVATEPPFSADNTGTFDSTAAIQAAIDACYAAGGGTVFLPVGVYKITAGITVKAFVTLRGDWQNPDEGTQYGTIIHALTPSSQEDTPALFTILGSAGVMGLTVYYPQQDIQDIKPYPFTFYVPGSAAAEAYMLQSIYNCTVINGYRGIGACVSAGVHEMLTVENFYGTFLKSGAEAYNQADVGTWKTLRISGKYWAQAGAGMTAPPREAIDAHTRANTDGLVLGDLEWTQFADIRVEDCRYGFHLVKGKRIEFAGSLFDVETVRCRVGIKADYMDTRWGTVVAKSRFEGRDSAAENNTLGVIKMTDTVLDGGTKGVWKIDSFSQLINLIRAVFRQGLRANNKFIRDSASLAHIQPEYAAAPGKPASVRYIANADKTGTTDVSAVLQQTLNTAGVTGGVVYLPAGKYRLERPITVPAGVELRGSSSVPVRDLGGSSKGTIFLAYYGLNTPDPENDTALVTLAGNAGVRGLRFIYPENSPVRPGAFGTVQTGAYTVRGTGSGVWAVNVSIVAAYNGIDFRGCDNHFIKKLVSCCYNNAILVGDCTGGRIEGCLQNGNVITRNGLNLPDWPNEGEHLFPYVFNAITRPGTDYIIADNADNQTVFNTFAYGVKTLINNTGSEGLVAFNIGADNIGGPMIITQGGRVTIINMMRYNGSSFTNNGTQLEMYNRLTIGDRTEKTVR